MVPSPKSQVTSGQSMQSQPLIACKLGLSTSHGVPSPKYDVDVYMATFSGCKGLGLVLRVGSSKKLDSTLKTSAMSSFAQNNQDPTLMQINLNLMIS